MKIEDSLERYNRVWTIRGNLEYYGRAKHDEPAIIDSDGVLTYGEYFGGVWSIATSILHRLNDHYNGDVPSNRPIIVFAYRNRLSVLAMMAVTLTRNFYIPLDPGNPGHRILMLLEKIRPAAILASGEDLDRMRSFTDDIPLMDIEELLAGEADHDLIRKVSSEVEPNDPICAIPTSGSTGIPKVVLKSHESVVDFISLFCETFSLTGKDVFGNQSSFEYDVAGKDIYSALYLGATLYIAPRGTFGTSLIAELNAHKVTVLVWPVAAMRSLVSLDAFSVDSPLYVKKVLFSGEAIPTEVLSAWREAMPDTVFVNLYGPTEVTYNCTYFVMDHSYTVIDRVPLGRAFSDQTVRYIGENGQDIKTGERGEICVSGVPVALGYYSDIKHTEEAFSVDENGVRTYRTGDIAELASDGQYYFIGRQDNQIKHIGHRIELEEIEHYAGEVEGVEEAGCIYDEEDDRIICIYIGDVDSKTLASELSIDLPKYMLPNKYVKVDEIPLTQNGKIDRKTIASVI